MRCSSVKKLENFSNCLGVLKNADFNFASNDEIYRMGILVKFNLTFELAWKALQAIMRLHGIQEAETGSPREILQLGFQKGFIEDSAVWLAMLKRRNLSVHLYDEKEINEMLLLIRDSFIHAFVELGELLQRKAAVAEEDEK